MPVRYITFTNEKIGDKELKVLTAYLGLLASKDAKRFVDYLNSPFFNADAALVGLFVYIHEAASRDTECISAKKLFKKWGITLEEKQLLQAIRKLTDYLKDFLVHAHVQTDERLHLLVFNARVRNQGLGDVVAEVVAKRKAVLAKAPLDMSILMEDWLIDHQRYYEYDTDREAKGLADLHNLRQKLARLYGAAHSMYGCEEVHLLRAAHQNPVPASPPPPCELPQLYDLHRIVFDAPVAELDMALEHFTVAFNDAVGSGRISPLNTYALVKYTINALSKAVTAGQRERMAQLYAWQLLAEEHQPKPIRRIPSGEFLNRVNVGCSLKELKETKAYIQRASPYLAPETRELDEGIANMFVLFEAGQYEAVLKVMQSDFLRRIDPHHSYNLRIKSHRLKTAMELILQGKKQYEDEFDRAVEDMKKFLSRKRVGLSEEVRKRNSNLVSLLMRLREVHSKYPPKKGNNPEYEAVLRVIDETSPLIAKSWLIQKVNEQLY